MKKLISALLALSVLLMSAVGYAEEIKMEIELPEIDMPVGSYMIPEVYTVASTEGEGIKLFSAEPEKPLFDYLYDILLSVDMNYYQRMKVIVGKDENNNDIYEEDDYMWIDLDDAGYFPTLGEIRRIYELFTVEYGELAILPGGFIKSPGGQNDDLTVSGVGFKYAYDLNEIKQMRAKIDEKVNHFINSLDSSLSDLEKVLLTHDFIAQNAIYQPDNSLIQKSEYHTLYSAIIEGVTVCQGYTLAMCYILNKLGVDCVACISYEIKHVWNCVNVDGKWYHVDLTWDDQNGTYADIDENYNFIYYSDFLLSSEDTLASKNDSGLAGTPITSDNFIYPSGKVTNETSDNNEYKSGYLFNNITSAMIFDRKDANGNTYYEHFEPAGFSLSNGKLIHKIRRSAKNKYEKEYSFMNDSLTAVDYGVSMPVKESDRYEFLLMKQNKSLDWSNNLSGFMKNNNNDRFAINSFAVNGGSKNGVYCFVSITDNEDISLIDNSNKTEFFFWDGNMRPLTQKTAYEN